MTTDFMDTAAHVTAIHGAPVQGCAALLEQAEAAGTAYLAALARAVALPDPDARRAAAEETHTARAAWHAAMAALTNALHHLGTHAP